MTLGYAPTELNVEALANTLKQQVQYSCVFTDPIIELLVTSASLYDFGKVGIHDSILM